MCVGHERGVSAYESEREKKYTLKWYVRGREVWVCQAVDPSNQASKYPGRQLGTQADDIDLVRAIRPPLQRLALSAGSQKDVSAPSLRSRKNW